MTEVLGYKQPSEQQSQSPTVPRALSLDAALRVDFHLAPRATAGRVKGHPGQVTLAATSTDCYSDLGEAWCGTGILPYPIIVTS